MKSLKTQIRSSDYGKLLLARRRRIRQKRIAKIDDYEFVCKQYYKLTGRKLDVREPKRFTEKLQWLKLFYRNDLMPVCSDKSALKQYLEKYGYGDMAIKTYGSWDKVENIPIEELPESFMLKASHGSSMHLVVKRKETVNWKIWKRIFSEWLKINISIDGREWKYNEIKPQIIAEELLQSGDRLGGVDYKFFCFHGEPKYIQVDSDLLGDHRIDFFDVEWNHLPLSCQFKNSTAEITKDAHFEQMVSIAKRLSGPFPHVRVDFLIAGTQLYISELTFFDGSGFYNFHPDSYDFIFGDELILPEPNFNLELYHALKKS